MTYRIYQLKLIRNIACLFFAAILFVGCDSDSSTEPDISDQFVSLESPYLVCASRNPGGVAFDFVYNGVKGGAQDLDANPEIQYDFCIKTVKAEKPDGTLGGMPAVILYGDSSNVNNAVMAVNASASDRIGTGLQAYEALTAISDNIISSLAADAEGFNTKSLPKGQTGKPMMNEVKKQYKKLAVGDCWKTAAKTGDRLAPSGDEQIWVIKTREGKYAKMMFTAFPAANAPTATGYVSIMWDLIN